MDKEKLVSLSKVDFDNVFNEISNMLRGVTPIEMLYEDSLAVATIIYLANKHENNLNDISVSLKDGVKDDQTLEYLNKKLATYKNIISDLQFKYNQDELEAVILYAKPQYDKFSSYLDTPDSISKLALELLDIHDNDKVADFGSGTGSFLLNGYKQNDKAEYTGIELGAVPMNVASIRNIINDSKFNLIQGNILSDLKGNKKYNKIFSNYPIGLRVLDLKFGGEFSKKVQYIMNKMEDKLTSDWIFNISILDNLEKGGKAIGIMSNSSAMNAIDANIRKYFINNGFIECVIALPPKIFEFTNISTTMLILSYGNEKVRMIDATNLCQKGRRQTYFNDNDIENILKLIDKDSDYSITINKEKIAENYYILLPSKFLNKNLPEYSNYYYFEEVVKSISRGASINANQLDELHSDEETAYQYLMLKNINDGIIDGQLPYIRNIDRKQYKYCLKDNMIVLAKNGPPFKVAIADSIGDQKILVNGNLYMIEVDLTKINPYYLKIFLESEDGQKLLSDAAVGSLITNISISGLNQIKIPKLNLEEQSEIVEKYKILQFELEVLKQKIDKVKEKLNSLSISGL